MDQEIHDFAVIGAGPAVVDARLHMGHYHGYEGFLTFSKLRPVFKQSPWRTINMLMPPYKGRASKVLDLMLKMKS
jgi:hypothetical protein